MILLKPHNRRITIDSVCIGDFTAETKLMVTLQTQPEQLVDKVRGWVWVSTSRSMLRRLRKRPGIRIKDDTHRAREKRITRKGWGQEEPRPPPFIQKTGNLQPTR